MKIVWQNDKLENQYSCQQRAVWDGVLVHRARVMPGRKVEDEAQRHEVNVLLAGNMQIERTTLTGQRYAVKSSSDSLCIIPAGQPTGAVWDQPLDNMGISLEPQLVVQTARDNHFSPAFDFNYGVEGTDPLIQQIGLTLLAESANHAAKNKFYADSLIQTLILHLLKNYTNAGAPREHANSGLSGYKLRRVKEFINERLEAELSLADIAAVADLSQFHFLRAFKKSVGLTPQQYLTKQRIERAKQLLSQGDLPLVEVSLQTGFKNQSHFTTLFRKQTNSTPKHWREMKLA